MHPQAWIKSLFYLTRHLKAQAGSSCPPAACIPVLREWKQNVPAAAEVPFDDIRGEFLNAWDKVKGPGADIEALKRADAAPPPAVALRYDETTTRRLVAWCRQLQHLQGAEPFYLSCRTVAIQLGIDHLTASRRLKMLVKEKVLEIPEGGVDARRRRATRYRYIAPPEPADDDIQF